MQLASGAAVPLGPITMDVQYPYPLMPSISMHVQSPMQPSAAAQSASSAAATNTLLKSLAQAAQVAQQALQQVSTQLSMQVSTAQPSVQMLPAASQAAASSGGAPSAPATSGTIATPSGAGTTGTSTIATSTTTSANTVSASSMLVQPGGPSSLALISPGVPFQQLQMAPFPVGYATMSGGPIHPYQPPLVHYGPTSGPPPVQQMLTPSNLASFMAYPSGLQPTLAPALPFGNLVGTSQKPPDENKSYWAKGTGYGHGNTTSHWNAEQSAQQRRAEESIITVYLEVHYSFLQC